MEFVPLLAFFGSVAAGWYVLRVVDLVRRGQSHRRGEKLRTSGDAFALPEGRVPCPECAEAILPQARRCPYCRQTIAQKVDLGVRHRTPPA